MNETTKAELKERLRIHGPPLIGTIVGFITLYAGSLVPVSGFRLPLVITSLALVSLSLAWELLRELGSHLDDHMAGRPIDEWHYKRPHRYLTFVKWGIVPFLIVMGLILVVANPILYEGNEGRLMACTAGLTLILIGAVTCSANKMLMKVLDIDKERIPS